MQKWVSSILVFFIFIGGARSEAGTFREKVSELLRPYHLQSATPLIDYLLKDLEQDPNLEADFKKILEAEVHLWAKDPTQYSSDLEVFLYRYVVYTQNEHPEAGVLKEALLQKLLESPGTFQTTTVLNLVESQIDLQEFWSRFQKKTIANKIRFFVEGIAAAPQSQLLRELFDTYVLDSRKSSEELLAILQMNDTTFTALKTTPLRILQKISFHVDAYGAYRLPGNVLLSLQKASAQLPLSVQLYVSALQPHLRRDHYQDLVAYFDGKGGDLPEVIARLGLKSNASVQVLLEKVLEERVIQNFSHYQLLGWSGFLIVTRSNPKLAREAAPLYFTKEFLPRWSVLNNKVLRLDPEFWECIHYAVELNEPEIENAFVEKLNELSSLILDGVFRMHQLKLFLSFVAGDADHSNIANLIRYKMALGTEVEGPALALYLSQLSLKEDEFAKAIVNLTLFHALEKDGIEFLWKTNREEATQISIAILNHESAFSPHVPGDFFDDVFYRLMHFSAPSEELGQSLVNNRIGFYRNLARISPTGITVHWKTRVERLFEWIDSNEFRFNFVGTETEDLVHRLKAKRDELFPPEHLGHTQSCDEILLERPPSPN